MSHPPLRRLVTALACLLLLAGLAACGTRDGGGAAPDAAAGPPVDGGILRAVTEGDPRLDPHLGTLGTDHYVLYPLYDRLVEFNPKDLTAVPGLASKWEYTTPNTLVFTLNQGVTFHDGTPFDAEAVKFNIERAKNEEKSSVKADLKSIDSVQVLDASTVQLDLNRPDTALPLVFSDRAGMMVSPTAVRNGTNLDDNPVGTGPFRFVSRVPGESLEYERYPAYWRPGPHLDGITITLLDDSRTATNALVSGQQDFIMQLDVADKARVDSSDAARVVVGPSLSVARCTFRFEKGPFSDVRVRQAVNYGIDREAINKVITQGLGEPAHAAVPSSHWAYPSDVVPVYTRDVAKARQLVAEAGHPDGLTIETVVVTSQDDRSMVEAMQAQLAEAGITLNVSVLDAAEAQPAFRERGEFDMFCIGWSGRPDPYQTYAALYPSASPYVVDFDEPAELQGVLAETVAVSDIDQRKAAFAALQELVTTQNALDFHVVFRPTVQAMSTKVGGYEQNIYGKPIINNVWLAK
ncbi:ABC transporter substrate-binding protein [Pseudonocardia lacus]|uniref:ABC transporter substrate-binding protein n=1 Tax=Pseudonocardia lacus TaxID=2835865 RepID=UPI001BDBB900|nr:ABC transporter substrate-binding protein [Pseudonocardia lacus]